VKAKKPRKSAKKVADKVAQEVVHHQLLTATLPTSDIRRQYTLMFTNTLNSHDFPLFLKFLGKYTSHDFVYAQTYGSNQHGDTYGHPSLVELDGVKPAAQYWFNKLQLLPDSVYGLLDTNVHTYNNSDHSKVVSDMTANASFMFAVDPGAVVHMGSNNNNNTNNLQLTDHTNNTIAGVKRERHITNNSYKDVLLTDINTTDIKSFLSSAKLIKPEKWSCEVKLVMHLDSNKSISRMEFLMVPRKEATKQQQIMFN
jgi:hypothetical protein